MIIAIDGPAGSGKSTTAREVARQLNYIYIDSGAMYRAVTLKALQQNIPTEDILRISEIAGNISFNFQQNSSQTILFLDSVLFPQL